MSDPTILELAVPARMWQRFDYLPPVGAAAVNEWLPGIRIQAPFGRRDVTAVLLKVKAQSDIAVEKLKNATARLDAEPLLTPSMLSLCEWASDYYHYPLGETVTQALPKALRQGRSCPQMEAEIWCGARYQQLQPGLDLNAEQQRAVEQIAA